MKSLLLTLGIILLGLQIAAPVATAAVSVPAPNLVADTKSDVCSGIGLAGGGCGDNGGQVNTTIAAAVTVLSVIVGVVAVIMIILSGLTYITSDGETSKIAKAKTSLIYAIVGLVIVAVAQTIVHFVLGKATNG